MAFELKQINVQLLQDHAQVVLTEQSSQTTVHINMKIETPGNQPENRLQEIAKEAARKALQGALAAL